MDAGLAAAPAWLQGDDRVAGDWLSHAQWLGRSCRTCFDASRLLAYQDVASALVNRDPLRRRRVPGTGEPSCGSLQRWPCTASAIPLVQLQACGSVAGGGNHVGVDWRVQVRRRARYGATGSRTRSGFVDA